LLLPGKACVVISSPAIQVYNPIRPTTEPQVPV
jgi:hypothetical protein